MSKARAIFLIDLIVVASAVGGILTVLNLPKTAIPLGEVQLSSILVQPSHIFAGQSTEISVNVTNLDVDPGYYNAQLGIDGFVVQVREVVLQGGQMKETTFTVDGAKVGMHVVQIGSAKTTFNVLAVYSPQNTTIGISKLKVPSNAVHPGDIVSVSALATNVGNETSEMTPTLLLDGVEASEQTIDLAAGAHQFVNFNLTVPALTGSDMEEIHAVQLANCSSDLRVVKAGYYMLTVEIDLPYGAVVSSLDGQTFQSSNYTRLLPAGNHTVVMSSMDTSGTLSFGYWGDKTATLTKVVYLTKDTALIAYYQTSASCPSLYAWNGSRNVYVSDVSNHGWLGDISYLQSDGTAVFDRNNPWDYVPLQSSDNLLNGGSINLTLEQRADEIFYLDQAYMVVVDHPANTNVYSTMAQQYLDPNYMGIIYATPLAQNLLTPISATNKVCTDNNQVCNRGVNVLPTISKMDGVFTKGNNGIDSSSWNNVTWNRLTLKFGDLSHSSQILLVVRAVVNWGSGNEYVNWLNKFTPPLPNGTLVTPNPIMEVVNTSGDWVQVPQGREMPTPADGVARTFVVNMTGLFPTSNYSVRISNFWNVTYDYVGIATSPQQNIAITKINPTATLYQAFPTNSTSSGNLTRYGNVTPLVLNEDDMFVIGRQGDAVSLQFNVSGLAKPAPGMVRSYFFFVCCWFKDINGNWGFGFGFTVTPLPFQVMSGFPYPSTESYPYDAEHFAYLSEYNTRVVAPPPP